MNLFGFEHWPESFLNKTHLNSHLREISPEYSLEGLMLKLKLQYSGHLMWRTDSFEKMLMLGKIEGRRRRGWQRRKRQWFYIIVVKMFLLYKFHSNHDQVNTLLGPHLGTLKETSTSEESWSQDFLTENMLQLLYYLCVNKRDLGSCHVCLTWDMMHTAKAPQMHSPGEIKGAHFWGWYIRIHI